MINGQPAKSGTTWQYSENDSAVQGVQGDKSSENVTWNLFKVTSPARTIARFEEYREAVRSRAGVEDSRCAANGNEMMRFHCSAEGLVYDAGIVCSATAAGGGIRTFTSNRDS